ncbi:hypothetical protein H6P81_001204 [Aristolochia fimbriata]|uniref:Uncharacterized protein n=1 Tax=Aristolochia fimbriata TaxID=158543 RepID=A0AAV7F7H2_ARIFI|nr:hypothetical protein H6P81_001204 [Aristolochia fimbriata]
MAAPSVTLVGGLRAFDHTVVVEGETIQTLALYMEGDASHMTYLPERESVFGGHAEKPTSLLSGLFTLDTALDKPIPFIFESGPLAYGSLRGSLLPQRWDLLWRLGIPLSMQVVMCIGESSFSRCPSPKTNTLVTRRGELSITRWTWIGFSISPMVADFKEVRSTDLPFSCRYPFLGRTTIIGPEFGSNVISSAAWVEFWFRTRGDVFVRLMTPGCLACRFWERSPSFERVHDHERDVFHFLHVTPGREDELYGHRVRFCFGRSPPWPAFTKVWDTQFLGWPSMARWPYLYTWLAAYFHTHGEDLEICADSSAIVKISPAIWGSQLIIGRLALYQSWWPFGKPALFVLVAGLICLHRENGTHLETQGPLQLIILGGRPTCRHYFSKIDWSPHCLVSSSKIDWSRRQLFPQWRIVTRTMTNDRSHPRIAEAEGQEAGWCFFARRGLLLPFWRALSFSSQRRRRHVKKFRCLFFPPFHQRVPSAYSRIGASDFFRSENPPIETVQILSSPEAPVAPQEEASEGRACEITPSPGFACFKRSPFSIGCSRRGGDRGRGSASPANRRRRYNSKWLKFQILRHRRICHQQVAREMGHDVTSPSSLHSPAYCTLQKLTFGRREGSAGTSVDEAEGIARNTLAVVSSKLEEAKATLGEVVGELSGG